MNWYQSLPLTMPRRGYVVASVNYRLGYVFLPGRYSNLERAMYNALQDVRASLRYLSHHHQELGIDPDMFFLGGHSAGGILSLTTAFMDETECLAQCQWQPYPSPI
jgi:acetyl esterase/lipase